MSIESPLRVDSCRIVVDLHWLLNAIILLCSARDKNIAFFEEPSSKKKSINIPEPMSLSLPPKLTKLAKWMMNEIEIGKK